MKVSTLSTVACAPALCAANAYHSWKFSGAPAEGMKDVTFGFNMANAPHVKGYYFANQFRFQNNSGVGYCGLQPRPDKNGDSIVHAAFSSFTKGATTSHKNCRNGADGGAGVSCAIDVTGDYDSTYNIEVENTEATSWRGTLVNTVTGSRAVVGEWTLPAGAGGVQNSQLGFTEYFPFNSGKHDCSEMPMTEITFFYPTSKTEGAGTGSIARPYESGKCKDLQAFETSQADNGWTIDVGF